MRMAFAVLASALMIVIAGAPLVSADRFDPGSPTYTDRMLGGFVTPTVAPGQTVNFAFTLTNPYNVSSHVMRNVTLSMGVYKYATQDESRMVNSSFTNPPMIDGTSYERVFSIQNMSPGMMWPMHIPIDTTVQTPHGSYFLQSTYFVRFRLVFNLENGSARIVLQSKGYFTDEEWSKIVSFVAGQPMVNTTYMHSLNVTGLLPDSSFGIKVPIPMWPLGVLSAACVCASVLALYYIVLENPGRYPRLEKGFYYLRGKLSELRSNLEDRG